MEVYYFSEGFSDPIPGMLDPRNEVSQRYTTVQN